LIIVNKVKTKSVNISVYAKFQEPVPMPDFISYPIGNSCNLIISVMAAWQIKFTEGSKPGKKHPLPIDLSTENKKAKRSAYEKERRLGRSFNQKWKDGRHWLSYNE
jgi:hypothetical protein